ncbi:MAG: biosynthetic-type acetolactate synthase large subunit [Spirochaetales bacterium]|nr:biosynthetic-type acetolactate synthase large subunit [Spirochaetales bacterium]
MKLTGAELIVQLLERQGIRTVAGIPGGANLPLYHALAESGLRHILVRHEQGGGFIAQGMARATGRAAVCFATSGPGATNLLTAIADAKLDSIPVIGITGQVPASLIGTDAFQEVDTYGLTIPITKHNYLVKDAAELVQVIPEAFRVALSGRPGPVVIDVPKDVQKAAVEIDALPEPGAADPAPRPDPASLRRAAEMISAAKRPVVYAGGGVISADASGLLRELVARCDLPVTATLMALGALPADDPRFLGMLGMHGSMATNAIVDKADLLIVCGARFDDRATGKVEAFAPNAAVIHIDVDSAELGKIRSLGERDAAVSGDVGVALTALLALAPAAKRTQWWKEIDAVKAAHPETPPEDPMHPWSLIRSIGAMAPLDAIVTTDVGQHQMWAAQAYPVRYPRSFLTSGGLGTMGFGLPAAIGAALARPECTVIALVGDGSLLMNVQELATLAEIGLNIKVFVFDNGQLGLVRQQQELFYQERYVASRFERRPDLAAIARGFGIEACPLASFDAAVVEQALLTDGPVLVNMAVSETENVFPMVPPGAANVQAIIRAPKDRAGRRS